ncbi:SPOR domain-containing protein [Bdellovibrio reynosensis]|uniref:SPOR domain-containing protein n=1 Tax=Bdellovibrio reynosensis TaxID=2835041 RepID=A0ABY4C872_9BACT|nr:SPOR domain-containing protein [Bdellovibrio reynosensis]UOF00924.1 SPOR domain-containing protein [Bdellovibrio reynosensis]
MSSKTDAVVKLAIVFFISLLSFSVGTFVGKKYSDNQHQLAALEPQKNTHGTEREVASVHGEERTGAMTDEEIAKLAEEFVADETVPATADAGHGEAHGETAHGEEPAHGTEHSPTPGHAPAAKTADAHKPAATVHEAPTTHTAPHAEPSTAAKNMVEGKNPSSHSAPTSKTQPRVPTALPKDVAQYAVGKFTVQVASYADEAEAQKMASGLKTQGYSAFYVPANINGKTWFRVSVGQFATQKEAQTYRTELLSKTKVGSAIVQKITE